MCSINMLIQTIYKAAHGVHRCFVAWRSGGERACRQPLASNQLSVDRPRCGVCVHPSGVPVRFLPYLCVSVACWSWLRAAGTANLCISVRCCNCNVVVVLDRNFDMHKFWAPFMNLKYMRVCFWLSDVVYLITMYVTV